MNFAQLEPDITLPEDSFLQDGTQLAGPEFSEAVQQKSVFPAHLRHGWHALPICRVMHRLLAEEDPEDLDVLLRRDRDPAFARPQSALEPEHNGADELDPIDRYEPLSDDGDFGDGMRFEDDLDFDGCDLDDAPAPDTLPAPSELRGPVVLSVQELMTAPVAADSARCAHGIYRAV